MATFYSAYVGNLRSYITVTEKSKDSANNMTLLSWAVYADKRYSHSPYNLTSSTPVQVSIDGTRVYSANINYDLMSQNTQLIASGETYVSHDADGSKTVSISLMVDFSSTGTAYGYGKTTASGSMDLATIARASTFSLSAYSFDFGANVTVTINRASSDFTHNVTYTQPNGTVTSVSTTATTSATVNIPISYADQLGEQSSYTTIIQVETKNSSGTIIDSQSKTATVNLPATAKPKITGLTPGGQNTIIGNNVAPYYNYLSGHDRVTTSITITNASGATTDYVEYRLVNENGTVVSSARGVGTASVSMPTPTVTSGSRLFTLKAQAMDSRARASNWVTSTIQLRVHAYSNPTIWGLTVGRLIADQTKVDGVVSWNVSRIYNGGGTTGQVNIASMTVKYRLKGASTWTNVTTNTALSTKNYDIPFDGIDFDVSSNYEFMAEVTDAFGKTSTTSIINVSGVFVHMDFGPKGVGIGKDHSDSNYDLEIGAGGVNSEGLYKLNGSSIQNYQITSDSGYSKHGSSANDFNSYTTTAVIHMSASAPNNPFNIWGLLFVMGGDGSNCVQMFVCLDGSRDVAVRSKTNGSWTAWNTLMQKESIELRDNQDLNNLTNTGRYYSNKNTAVSKMANTPDNKAGWIDVVDTGDMVYQIWYSYHGNNVFFRRNYKPTGWSTSGWSNWTNLNGSSNNAPVVKKTVTGTSYRYEDGAQIIYGSGSFSSSGLVELTFPEAFKSSTKPTITLTIEQNDRWQGVLSSVITSSSTGFSASVMTHDLKALSSFNVYYVAHGQWK